MKTEEDEAFEDIERRQGGFQAKRAMAADKLQEPVNLLEARRIAAEYGTSDSQVDNGNLYFALSKCLEHIDAQPAQEPVACVQDLDEVKRKHLVYEKGMDWKDPLYTAPPQRQPLTDDEMWSLWNSQGSDEMNQQEAVAFARAVEAAHNIGAKQ
jgi:hypothetical protein